MTDNAIAKEIVAAAFRIHTPLGPGLLESVLSNHLGVWTGPPGTPHGEPAADSGDL